ncbi:recombinase family protein [Planococcus halotolerans]|uniref:Recombinase family protein n=1 Tax=Planococcus halotolerans TaxID=2233542 RepID=A0A365L819_9BACL|nr:recombinase family protein [Planococcus halotolerans]RAZ81523.1 recombinase family protein [Planococcus halotolerans]
MEKKTFYYIRVSSKDQNEARQLAEIKGLGINERDVFIDKESGKDFNRTGYQTLKKCLREGDLLYVKSIDRFGRNSKEIKREWEEITQSIKADIKVLDMPLLDTTQHKDILGTFVNDLVLQVLAFVSERERETILLRQSEGIAIAKAEGKHLGRPSISLNSLSQSQLQTLSEKYAVWKAREITGTYFADLLKLKKNTFYKIIKEFEGIERNKK